MVHRLLRLIYLSQAGCYATKILVLVAAPEGIKALEAANSDVELYIESIDDHLDKYGYVVPGLGDPGDKLFDTKYHLLFMLFSH